ncbi:four helix bundle protein [Candidatus Microgenomates bacterium]|nr:four helix bundle protein [Candidatus Microgenomates bacterium]
MSNDKFPIKRYDIHDRIFEFIVSVIELIKLLPKSPQNLIIIGQVMRSVTSMGANDQEADGSSTRKDFLHCYTIVRKEGKETIFWLKLLERTNNSPLINKKINDLIKEGNEIVAIVSTIISKTAAHTK